MVVVLGDLIIDLNLHISAFPIQAEDLKPVTYLDIGPGGASNVAIVAAHLGLPVTSLGEIGNDPFGQLLLGGLQQEGIETSHILVSPGVRTPVVGVLVDEAAEPAYLGYSGDPSSGSAQTLARLPSSWKAILQNTHALFADGWIDYQGGATLILDAFRFARAANIPIFFDPGPGNPALDNMWHNEAVALATVLLATEEEAQRLSNQADPLSAAQSLLASGPELVVVKRSAAGCLLLTAEATEISPGFPVQAVDATGAGDSLDAAVIYGYLQDLPLPALGLLANATGAAKVQKLGTGHNLPSKQEIMSIFERFGIQPPFTIK